MTTKGNEMTPNATWPIGFEFLIDVNPDHFTIVDGGVEVHDCDTDRTRVIPFGSKELRETFAGQRIFSNRKLVECFVDGKPIFHGER